jgi:hypothetical protein
MIIALRKNVGFNVFCILMALHLLNCMVDVPDATGRFVPEELDYNDMESLVEVVAEQLMGFENCFPEYDDVDTEDQSTFKVKKILELLALPKDSTPQVLLSSDKGMTKLIIEEDQFVFVYPPSPLPPPPWLS